MSAFAKVSSPPTWKDNATGRARAAGDWCKAFATPTTRRTTARLARPTVTLWRLAANAGGVGDTQAAGEVIRYVSRDG